MPQVPETRMGEWPLEKGYPVKETFHILLEAGLSVEVKAVMGLKRWRQGDCSELKDSLGLPRAHTVRPVFIHKQKKSKEKQTKTKPQNN